MTLTLGTGPFAKPSLGALNFDLATSAPAHVLYLHDVGFRVRGLVDGEVVVDSRRVKLLHETALLPRWYFPQEDVTSGLLVATDHHTHCPFKGEASYWSIQVGDRLEENAVWGYPDPVAGAPPLAGLVSFYQDKVDTWMEEDEVVASHPRDPFHRVDTRASERHVVVRVGGRAVAESHRPVALFETGLPVRWYLPRDDVDLSALEPSDTTARCPYKGLASYWSLAAGDTAVADVAWTYEEPLAEAVPVAGHLCFLGDDVEIVVDGEPIP